MNMVGLLNVIYGIISPFAHLTDIVISKCVTGDIWITMYYISIPICFLRSLYLVPSVLRKVDPNYGRPGYDDPLGYLITTVLACILWIVVFTFFGLAEILIRSFDYWTDRLIRYAVGRPRLVNR